ncbi:MAG: TonB-dependent siderophore receptor [Betaproteobacteria bacterium]|nr:TonB-dependent siderophore receptor [Betaproteobacteria bacterium]
MNKTETRARCPHLPRFTPVAAAAATAALAAALGCPAAALAQQAAAPAGAASAPAGAPADAKTEAPAGTVLPVVRARAAAEPQGKDSVQATTTRIGKGQQELRDIPQSVTVVTERLIDDRNLDTLKDVLRQSSGISFLAAEGGEEDIRLRGFSLQGTGDVFVDGMRDPAFYERDTFFFDRIEILRGSASMLFGRGSTGGAVNMVTRVPRLVQEHQLDVTMGSHGYLRAVGDFNLLLAPGTALRLGTMFTEADNNGAGSSLSKRGIAGTLNWGIGERHEFSASAYHLDNENGMNYGMPFIRPTLASPVSETTLLPLDPTTYYGMASDRNDGSASTVGFAHTWRLARDEELVTRLRGGHYERDQRAGTVRFANAAAQPGGVAVSLETFGPNTVINRGTQLKIQDLDTLFLQSDYTRKFKAFGMGHSLQAGFDLAHEKKRVYAARNAAQGGVVPIKPTTLVGTPDDGAWIDESSRVLRLANRYKSQGEGLYVQDLVEFIPKWKALVGLRYDHLVGDYDTLAIPNNAPGPETTASYRMKVSEMSKRAGLLFQPNERMSFHFSYATSFNTSGDAYSLSAANVDIPPEESINLELGAKIDSADGNFTARIAAFRATKLHERNTDPLVNLVTLSGKRHVAGFEIDLSGRLTPAWEVWGSYMWMPVAKIDVGVPGADGEGARPSLTPQHTGSIWTTYKVSQALRVGGGLNARSGQQPLRNPGYYAPKFITGDLMAEYHVVYDKLIFKANLINVTDKLYADQLYPGHYVPGPGRMLQVTGSYKFN